MKSLRTKMFREPKRTSVPDTLSDDSPSGSSPRGSYGASSSGAAAIMHPPYRASSLDSFEKPPSPINQSNKAVSRSSLDDDKRMNSRVVAVEDWMDLRYGEVTRNGEPVPENEGPSEELNRKYWFHIIGGFLAWFVTEEHGNNSKNMQGRIDLKNDVMTVSEVVHNDALGIYELTITTQEKIHKKELSNHSDGKNTYTKVSVKAIVENTTFHLGSSDQAALVHWKEAITKYVNKKAPSVHEVQLTNHFVSLKTDDQRKHHLSPRGSNLLTPDSSSTNSSPSGSPLGSPRSPSPRSPVALGAGSSGLDTKGRMVKMQGYLELQTKIEDSDGLVDSKKQRYWFELLGGYLNWYPNDSVARSGHPVGRVPIKAGDAEVGEIYFQRTEDDEKLFSFTLASTEEIKKKEEQINDHDATFTKTSLKRERTTFTLSSTNEFLLVEWRQQISAMAKRKHR